MSYLEWIESGWAARYAVGLSIPAIWYILVTRKDRWNRDNRRR